MTDTKSPRGIINNNPLCISRVEGSKWHGRKLIITDTEFEEFVAMEYGIRAALRLLYTYNLQGNITLGRLMRKWAALRGHNIEAYVKFIVKETSFKRSKPLSISCPCHFIPLIRAMAFYECGQYIKMETIARGFVLASTDVINAPRIIRCLECGESPFCILDKTNKTKQNGK